MLSNHYENIDISNGMMWNYNSYYEKNSFDWTSSISWNYSEALTFTLKGENLLGKAQTYDIFRVNPLNGMLETPLSLSAFDQRISIELEYLF